MRAGIGFGSNLADRFAHLKTAREKIAHLPSVEMPILVSAVYETKPIDCEPGAPDFLNAVIEIEYSGGGEQLLRELRLIEGELGRPRDHASNASRTIDLDLLYFGGLVLSLPHLQLPHPRMLSRRFVLEPLAEIRPDLILPGETETVAQVLQRLPDGTPLVQFASQW